MSALLPPGTVLEHLNGSEGDMLRSWLEATRKPHWVIPRTRPSIFRGYPDDPVIGIEKTDERVFTRQKAAGMAPYVGRPFIYVWDLAIDPSGVQVAASEARIHYTEKRS